MTLATPLETVRRYLTGEITERQACDWFDCDRLAFREEIDAMISAVAAYDAPIGVRSLTGSGLREAAQALVDSADGNPFLNAQRQHTGWIVPDFVMLRLRAALSGESGEPTKPEEENPMTTCTCSTAEDRRDYPHEDDCALMSPLFGALRRIYIERDLFGGDLARIDRAVEQDVPDLLGALNASPKGVREAAETAVEWLETVGPDWTAEDQRVVIRGQIKRLRAALSGESGEPKENERG
jgi:hypothetical protein